MCRLRSRSDDATPISITGEQVETRHKCTLLRNPSLSEPISGSRWLFNASSCSCSTCCVSETEVVPFPALETARNRSKPMYRWLLGLSMFENWLLGISDNTVGIFHFEINFIVNNLYLEMIPNNILKLSSFSLFLKLCLDPLNILYVELSGLKTLYLFRLIQKMFRIC